MDKIFVEGLAKFRETFDASAKDAIWREHSAKFRKFWCDRVLSKDMSPISNDNCDAVIRILDSRAKGHRKGDEAVANVMTPQPAWRRLFNILHTERKLGRLVNAIFTENDPNRKAGLIDELYKENEGNRNRLTGESANVLNALLAAYDPISNLSIVSLKDRKAQMNFLEPSLPFDWSQASYGTRIVQSNSLLCAATRNLGIEGSATLCRASGTSTLSQTSGVLNRCPMTAMLTGAEGRA